MGGTTIVMQELSFSCEGIPCQMGQTQTETEKMCCFVPCTLCFSLAFCNKKGDTIYCYPIHSMMELRFITDTRYDSAGASGVSYFTHTGLAILQGSATGLP